MKVIRLLAIYAHSGPPASSDGLDPSAQIALGGPRHGTGVPRCWAAATGHPNPVSFLFRLTIRMTCNNEPGRDVDRFVTRRPRSGDVGIVRLFYAGAIVMTAPATMATL